MNRCLHQLIQAQAERTPDAAAVVFEAEVLRDQLRTKLPEYILLTTLVMLPSLHVTANWKVDRRAPAMPVVGRPYGVSRTATEQTNSDMEQVLGTRQVGLENKLLTGGGCSARATSHGKRVTIGEGEL